MSVLPVRTRELAARLLLCAACVRLSRSSNNGKLILGGVLALNAFGSTSLFHALLAPLFPTSGQSLKDKVASCLLHLKGAREEYANHVNEHAVETRTTAKQVWEKFGTLITKIPEKGLPEAEIKAMIDKLSDIVEKGIVDDDISGSIYPYAYRKAGSSGLPYENTAAANGVEEDWNHGLMDSLDRLFTHAFRRSYLWNSLHEAEFGIGYWLNHQVIKMVADMFTDSSSGSKAKDKVMGLITSGGTDSLMNMVRLYKNWGNANRSLDFGEGILVVCENIHAAVDKGCEVVGVKVLVVPTNEKGSISIPHLKAAVRKAGSCLVGVAVSAPSFSLGAIDDVKAAAEITKAAGVGLHVDCCLGGFVINFLDHCYSNFLDIDGVTTISCDTHKNGWAPKGSSVLLTMPAPDHLGRELNLSFYSSYAIPSWDGGVYGSPGNPGSQHCHHTLQAYVAMLRIGKDGYRQLAQSINVAVNRCVEVLKKDDRIELLGEHSVGKKGVNVFAFKLHPRLKWGVGASYALANEMSKHKVILSAIKGDRIHYAVTPRSSLAPGFVERFEKAFVKGMEETEKCAQLVLAGKANFGGDAGLYGTLDAAMTPTTDNTETFADYVGNMLLGKRVAHDLIHSHFYALQDPFSEHMF